MVANLDCDNDTAEISWSLANGAASYVVTAVAADGHLALCETDEHHCEMTELQCGQMYNISLTTIGSRCQTESHANVSIYTRE